MTLHTLHGVTAIALGRTSGEGAELSAVLRRFDAIWAALPPRSAPRPATSPSTVGSARTA